MPRALFLALTIATLLSLPAQAAECGAGGKGQTSIHYDTGQTRLTTEHKARLAEFAEVAKFRDAICVFAQVDAQGSDAANLRVAEARAQTVKRYLVTQGVPADRILIAKEVKGQTLFGLFGEDSQNDRRVTVSYD